MISYIMLFNIQESTDYSVDYLYLQYHRLRSVEVDTSMLDDTGNITYLLVDEIRRVDEGQSGVNVVN